MNLEAEILKEHSKVHALKIAAYACSSQTCFKELMSCFMSDNYRLAQRAAWSVSWSARKKPVMVIPYIKDLVAVLEKNNVHDAVIRNSLRVLQDIDIPEEYHGIVINACFRFIECQTTPVAFTAFSLTILEKLSRFYPDIKSELKLLIEENWNNATPAFRSRAKKIMKKI